MSDSLSSGALGVPPAKPEGVSWFTFAMELSDQVTRLRASLAAVSEERDAATKDRERMDFLEEHWGFCAKIGRPPFRAPDEGSTLRGLLDDVQARLAALGDVRRNAGGDD